ncbi:MAG TPA: glycosyltransferase [Cyanobacteria bacterium UBA11149]|nr:glycosyltransferase [Cyanobacteria bacterium UBA11367]HBE59056.1 glycosyltransferase [Cyanobacteria bacterium UBA11366]HBK63630.1 glycosyltransferase [Cyanobacteria bacterium UBA11166]HBR72296.1 glycosyltransferase [Cyanobacteria bacterium UBA11159]HBS71894.1 glycosyltransferase [Cyanobacteria bacterium UBA11153]HBW90320.1 glycosyltransferase [Cyanobacteria bacterium UBA11149]HCA93275.1 glycosyltransferase [Cyanobacteria bacterium UBA9226]
MNVRVDMTVRNWYKSWEKYPKTLWILSILWLIAISWIAFLWHLGSIGLVDETEPLFAEAARQMTVTGDWITPYFNGVTRFDKPPLIYWLMAIAYKLIGVNEWAVRLPSALSAIALTSLGFYTLRYFGISRPSALSRGEGRWEMGGQGGEGGNFFVSSHSPFPNLERQRWISAWIGAALIAINPITLVWARTGVSDMLLSGCMGTALLAFFLGYVQKEKSKVTNQNSKVAANSVPPNTNSIFSFPSGWYLAFYILIAMAILAKGPVGIVLPGLIIGGFLIYLGKLREVLREMGIIWGLSIISAIAVPWYVLVIIANGEDYINKFFGYHNIERFTSVVNHHWAPWYFYFIVVLVGFAPWSSYLPVAIARLRFWQRNRWQSSPRCTQLGLFALFWLAGIFGFFTIAVTKLPSYVIPLMPAAAILVALWWSDLFTYREDIKNKRLDKKPLLPISSRPLPLISYIFNTIFLLILATAMALSPKFIGYDPAAPKLAQLVQESGLSTIGGIIWGITAIAAILALGQRNGWRWLFPVNLLGFVAFILFVITPASFLMDEARQQPLRQLSAIATQLELPGEELVMMGFEKPSVAFYSQRLVHYFDEDDEAIAHIENIAKTHSKPPSALVLIDTKRFNEVKENFLKFDEYKTLASAGAYQLVRISK